MRPWQQRGLEVWGQRRERGHRDMLVTACPAAGKTALALQIAHTELGTGRCARIVVVVPTRQLKRQWARAAQRAGIRLTATWGNGAAGMPQDVDGVVVTYSQVARLPEAVHILCGRHRVLAILDEIHHGGQGRAWGKGCRKLWRKQKPGFA